MYSRKGFNNHFFNPLKDLSLIFLLFIARALASLISCVISSIFLLFLFIFSRAFLCMLSSGTAILQLVSKAKNVNLPKNRIFNEYFRGSLFLGAFNTFVQRNHMLKCNTKYHLINFITFT